jgi:integrase/recombinase XerD
MTRGRTGRHAPTTDTHPEDRGGSAVAPVIARYVALKRALGRRFDVAHYRLSRLERFLASQGADDLDGKTFREWCSTFTHLSCGERRLRMQVVYQFCLFRRRSEPGCFVPDRSQFPPMPPRPQPYIFTEGEIVRLLRASDALEPNAPSPLHPQVARLAVTLLYTAGLRRGEVVRLTLGDYDATERVLLIRDSKFHKSRLLPLSDDAAREMACYLRHRLRPSFPRDGAAPLLLHRHGGLTGYTGPGLAILLRKLFHQAAVRTPAGQRPRVHDLRFSFAVHALLRWYTAGVDVQVWLPALSRYMGHASIESTQYYLTFLEPLARAACDRFESHCRGFLAGAMPVETAP